MPQPQPGKPHLFVDSIICGAIGLGIAAVFGRRMFLWGMLCALAGPLFILWAGRLVHLLPDRLPGKYSGTYEFMAFAFCIAIVAALGPFTR